MSGRFITFEGGEGAGKSTQVERLRRRLEERGVTVVTTREPGGSPRAEAIRASVLAGDARPFGPLAEALMFCAARADHLARVIRPALMRGDWVICDRFSDSTAAYQGAVGEVDPGLIRTLDRLTTEGIRPDLTLVLDVPANLGLARASARRQRQDAAADRFEAEGPAFHERLRRAFLDIAHAEPERCVLIDARRDADAVEGDVWEAVEARLIREPTDRLPKEPATEEPAASALGDAPASRAGGDGPHGG